LREDHLVELQFQRVNFPADQFGVGRREDVDLEAGHVLRFFRDEPPQQPRHKPGKHRLRPGVFPVGLRGAVRHHTVLAEDGHGQRGDFAQQELVVVHLEVATDDTTLSPPPQRGC
jgi:hypothetical protein